MKVKKGDTVKVLYGKDSGKTGKVLSSSPRTGKVVVDGVNVYKKHIKGDGRDKKSQIAEIVKSMNVAKVMLVCPECKKDTRVKYSFIDGKKFRMCSKCNKPLDKKKTVEEKKPVKAKLLKEKKNGS